MAASEPTPAQTLERCDEALQRLAQQLLPAKIQDVRELLGHAQGHLEAAAFAVDRYDVAFAQQQLDEVRGWAEAIMDAIGGADR